MVASLSRGQFRRDLSKPRQKRAAARHFADEQAAAVADQFGVNVFKTVAALEHAVYVHATLVGEGVAAHVGHAFIHVEVGKFADEARRIAQKGQIALRQGAQAHLQFQIGQHFAEIGVAAALAIAR